MKKRMSTAAAIAKQAYEDTKFNKTQGANSLPTGRLYTKKQYLKDKNKNNSKDDVKQANVQYKSPDNTVASIENFAQSLIRYSRKDTSQDLAGFLMVYEIPPNTFFTLRDKHKVLSQAYSMALNNFAHNNLRLLNKRLPQGAATAALKLHHYYSPALREMRASDWKYQASLRALAAEELVEIRKKLIEQGGTIKVKVEY